MTSSRAAQQPQERRGGRAVLAGVAGCFVLSGFAGLLYQTAWMRQFSIVFGTSELALAAVLASYMGGLATGAAAASRFVGRVRRPILVYGALELGIALSAMALPFMMALAGRLQTAALGGQPDLPAAGGAVNAVFHLACAFVLLLVPTALMGATLPLLTHHVVTRPDEIGRRSGLLYALNAGGAVAGTLVAAFLFLPHLGLRGTVLIGAAANVLVFVIAAIIGRHALVQKFEGPRPARARRGGEPVEEPPVLVRRAAWVLPIMLVSGAVSFTYEVLWSRLLAHLLGGSLHAFAIMLASFLTGIALGSAAAAALARDRAAAARGLVAAQIGTALLSAGAYAALDPLAGLGRSWGAGERAALAANLAIAALILLPSTLCIGATFPFAVRILAGRAADAGPAAARVFAWNTLGAIAGAVLAGFLVIPALRFEGTVRAAVATNLTLALATAFVLAVGRRPVRIGLALAAVLVVVVFRPPWPERLLRTSPISSIEAAGRLVYYGVGRSATVLLVEHEGRFNLRCNGMPEAAVARRGAPPGAEPNRWLAALPALARPAARSMLMVGLGGGVALGGVPSWVEAIDVIELEGEVLEANRRIAGPRLSDPLADRRVRITLNDARGALAVTDKRYDLIVSQPSHPWTAGASHLYTRDFLVEARAHLEPGGVFVQWMNSYFLDGALLRTLGATLLEAFPEVRLYAPDPDTLLFLASDEAIEPALRRASGADDAMLRSIGIRVPEDLAAALVLDARGLAALCQGAPVNTDDHNRLATAAAGAARRPLGGEGLELLIAAHDPLLQAGGPFEGAALDRPYMARWLAIHGFARRARAVADAIDEPARRHLAQALVARLQGRRRDAAELLARGRRLDPADGDLRYALIEPALSELASGTAAREIAAAADSIPLPARAIVEGWGLLVKGDCAGLRELEAVLAGVDRTSVCFPQAARLRAQWRTCLSGDRGTQGREAIDILDEALTLENTLTLYELRVQAALLAGERDAVIETAGLMSLFIERQAVGASPARRRALAEMSGRMRAAIIGLEGPGGAPAPDERVQEVIARLERLAGP